MSEEKSQKQGENRQDQQDKGRQSQQDKGQGRREQRDNLQTERGNTTIQDGVVARISGLAAQEVEGIRMGNGASQRAAGLLGSVTGGSGGTNTQGVTVEVGQEEAAVDLTLMVEYGRSVPQVADAVRRNIINRVESLVGLRVTEVNVSVTNIFFPQQEQQSQQEGSEGGQQEQQSSGRVS